MDSNGCVPEAQVSSATSVNETDEDATFRQEIEQLKQHMTQLKSSNSFEETVKFKNSNVIRPIKILLLLA